MRLLLFFTDKSKKYYSTIKSALDESFDFLNFTEPRVFELEEEWFNEATEQYDAIKILKGIQDQFKQPFLYTIFKDLYVPRMNFIFGRAVPYSGAILSLKRLETEDQEVFKSRIRKEAKHEVGHIFGLSHCKSNCLMRFSSSTEEVDQKPEEFCMSCKNKLKKFER